MAIRLSEHSVKNVMGREIKPIKLLRLEHGGPQANTDLGWQVHTALWHLLPDMYKIRKSCRNLSLRVGYLSTPQTVC